MYRLSKSLPLLLIPFVLSACVRHTVHHADGTTVTHKRRVVGPNVTTVRKPDGTVVHHRDRKIGPDVTIVKKAPPAPKREVRGRRPSLKHTWVPGHWEWKGNKWKWQRGRWVVAPRRGAKWVPASWVKTPKGWKFTPGHWKR
jgi:hypothetical protein